MGEVLLCGWLGPLPPPRHGSHVDAAPASTAAGPAGGVGWGGVSRGWRLRGRREEGDLKMETFRCPCHSPR